MAFRNVIVLYQYLNVFWLSFEPLNGNNFLDGVSDVEGGNVPSELPCLDLSVVEEVLDHGGHEFRRRLLNVGTDF